jgi:hypothetical protein
VDDDDDGLKPDQFYWIAQAVSVLLICFALGCLSVAAHLMDVRPLPEMTEAQSGKL